MEVEVMYVPTMALMRYYYYIWSSVMKLFADGSVLIWLCTADCRRLVFLGAVAYDGWPWLLFLVW